MGYYVYILYSEKLGRYYIGTTTDVVRRLNEHNTAYYKDSYSSRGIPWNLFLSIPCDSSAHAYILEAFIKKMKSAVFIRKLKDEHGLIDSIMEKIRSGFIGIPKPRDDPGHKYRKSKRAEPPRTLSLSVFY